MELNQQRPALLTQLLMSTKSRVLELRPAICLATSMMTSKQYSTTVVRTATSKVSDTLTATSTLRTELNSKIRNGKIQSVSASKINSLISQSTESPSLLAKKFTMQDLDLTKAATLSPTQQNHSSHGATSHSWTWYILHGSPRVLTGRFSVKVSQFFLTASTHSRITNSSDKTPY